MASSTAGPGLGSLLVESVEKARELRGRGFDPALIDPQDFDVVLATGEMPRRNAKGLLTGGSMAAPRLTAEPASAGEGGSSGVRRRALADVQPRSVRFLVPGLIPLRTLTLIAGVGGLGKSTLALAYAAALSRGDLGVPGDALIVSYEDTAAEMLRPRLEAAGADLSRVHELYVEPGDGGLVVLPRHVDAVEEHVRATAARLVIVDPIVAAIDLALDTHKDQHVRAVLARLSAIAEETDCAIAMIGHLNKAPSGDPYLRVANSVAFWNAARSVILVTEDPDEPDHQRLVTQRKTNWAALAGVERHVIESIELPHVDPATGRPIVTSRMRFVEKATDVDRGNVLLAPSARKGATAGSFLADELADGDWHDSAGLKELAAEQGISDRTLKRAAAELEVEKERHGFPSTTWWRLSVGPRYTPTNGPTVASLWEPHDQAVSDAPAPQSGHPSGDGTTGPTTGPTGEVST